MLLLFEGTGEWTRPRLEAYVSRKNLREQYNAVDSEGQRC